MKSIFQLTQLYISRRWVYLRLLLANKTGIKTLTLGQCIVKQKQSHSRNIVCWQKGITIAICHFLDYNNNVQNITDNPLVGVSIGWCLKWYYSIVTHDIHRHFLLYCANIAVDWRNIATKFCTHTYVSNWPAIPKHILPRKRQKGE